MLNLIGNFVGNVTGLGVHCRGFGNGFSRIMARRSHVMFTDTADDSEVKRAVALSEALSDDVLSVIISVGDPRASDSIFRRLKGRRGYFFVFESDRLPDGWVDALARYDVIWTPSAWSRQMLIANGLSAERIFIVPEGVDPTVFNPWGGGLKQFQNEKFRFLMIGKFEERKSYAETLEAFRRVVAVHPNVELYLKPDHFSDPSAAQGFRALMEQAGHPSVRALSGKLDEATLAALYRSCHAFVFPSKCEGWGLPLIEAMASGLPAVTTDYSGHAQFLAPCRGLFEEVAYDLEHITAPDFLRWGYKYAGGFNGRWAKPRSDSIAAGMDRIIRDYSQARRRALQASDIILRSFSWEAAALRALHVHDLMMDGGSASDDRYSAAAPL